MNPWALVPLPAIAALLAAAVAALIRKGPPAGRTIFVFWALAAMLPVALLAAALWRPTAVLTRFPTLGANAGLLALPALSVALAFRFAREGKGLGRFGAPLAWLAGATSFGLLIAGAFGADAVRINIDREGSAFEIRNAAARALIGVLLLTGAAGVVLFQSFWESARRDLKPHLRHAAAGFLLTSLGLFLVAGQTLLYGGADLHILSLTTLGALPAALFVLPVFRARDADAVTLSDRARCEISSGVLMSLGIFLIALAVVGEAIEKIVPAGRLLWFHWGGTILVGGFAAIWLVPGLRGRARSWFRVPFVTARYEWNWRPPLRVAGLRSATATVLASVTEVLGRRTGGAAMALWIRRDASPDYEPWSDHDTPLPVLTHDNPIPALFRPWAPVVDLTTPPSSLSRVAAYVENLELVERQGFRMFVALSSGTDVFGILAIAPRASHMDPSAALTLEFSAGSLAAAIWGGLLAASPSGTAISGESWLQATELLHQTATEARAALSHHELGERLAAWATSCADTCAERAGAAVGRVSLKPRRGGASSERQTEVRS